MVFSPMISLLRQTKITTTSLQYVIFNRGYAVPAGGFSGKLKKGKKGGGATSGKIRLPVETDAKKLVSHVCGSNIYKEGEDIKLKDDSEYPDWLWNIRTGDPPKLEDLDPTTKAYWRKLREISMRRNNRLAATRKF